MRFGFAPCQGCLLGVLTPSPSENFLAAGIFLLSSFVPAGAMSSGKGLETGGFELLTASSGESSTTPASSYPAAGPSKMNGAHSNDSLTGGNSGGPAQSSGVEMDAIRGFLAACKGRIAKEHREKQETEWQANKLGIASLLDSFRVKKRQLSRTGRTIDTDASHVASSTSSSSSSPSRAPPRPAPAEPTIPLKPAVFSYDARTLAFFRL